MLPCKNWYWDMHGFIFETIIWQLVGTTRWMELHTNRAAKHRYGKQRCKTSDMTFSYEKKELTNPKHVRYRTNVRRSQFISKTLLLSFLIINETDQLRTQRHGSAWYSRNERLTPHPPLKQNCNRKKAVTIQPSKAGCQNSQKGDSTSQKNSPLPPPPKKSKKKKTNIAQADISRTRTTQWLLLTSALTHHTTIEKQKFDRFKCALWPNTSHKHDTFGMTICILRRQLNIWIDLDMISLLGGQELLSTGICWKSRRFLLKIVLRKERRGKVK